MDNTSQVNYPINFHHLDKLIVGSNTLHKGVNILEFEGKAPILIGAGIVPIVWLYARQDKNVWFPIAIENITLTNNLHIETIEKERRVIFKNENKIILDAKMTSDSVCIVDILDLRPTGINFYADKNEAQIGGTILSQNSFEGAQFMVGIQ